MIAKCGTVIIGYGGMGGWHTQQLKTMEEINLLGVYDILPGRNLLAEEKGLHAYSSFEEVLNDPQVDLVTVAIPNDQHRDVCIQAMEAGKNVKMEGKENNLIELILQDEMFKPVWNRMDEILDAKKFIGRAPSQTVEFIKKEIDPILSSNASLLGEKGDVRI